jgi:molybdopterin-containing oxidoreductase family membrane subunit
MSADAREASLRPFARPSLSWWLTVAGLGALVAVGIFAWVVQLRGGMGVAGYNDHAFWAIYIADAITFIGVSYGGAVVSAILRLTGATWRAPLTRLAEGTAIVTVLIGTALIVPHIANPILMWEMFVRPNVTSPVFWDLVAVTTYTFASIVFFALPLVPDMAILGDEHPGALGRGRRTLYAVVSRGWVGAPQQRSVLSGALGLVSILIIPLAVSVHSNLAWIFATTSRPWWHESIWAPQFVVAALYSGVALVILVLAGFRRGYHLEAFITARHFVRLGFILATFAATYLYLTFADLLPGAYVADKGTEAVFAELLVGRLAPWFWLFAIVGGVLPLLLVALPWTRNIKGMVIAALLIVPMMWLKRILMVVGGGTYDVVTGAFGRYHFTWVPVAITLAATAAIPLLLMLLFRVVPLLSIDEIEEIEQEEEMANAASAAAYQRAEQLRASEAGQPADKDKELVGATGKAHRGSVAGGAAVVVALVALLGAFGVGAAPSADAATAPSGPKIVITGVEDRGAVALTAKLTDAAGKPLAKAEVKFLLASNVFGPRQVLLGTVATDASGTAKLVIGTDSSRFRPTTSGPQEFVASYTGDGAEPVEFATNVNVSVARSAYTPAPPKALAGAGNVLIKVLFIIVASIWILLISQIIRIRRVCRPQPKAAVSSA